MPRPTNAGSPDDTHLRRRRRRGPRSFQARAWILCAALPALLVLSGCVGGWGRRYTTELDLPPAMPPIPALVVDGPRKGEPSPVYDEALRRFFGRKARFRTRRPTATELAAAAPVTSTETACALGRALKEATIVWTEVNLRSKDAFKCIEQRVEPRGKSRLVSVCLKYGDEKDGFVGEISVDVHVVTEDVSQCSEKSVLHVEQRAVIDVASEALAEAQLRAAREVVAGLEDALPIPHAVVKATSSGARVAPGSGEPLEAGALFDVVRESKRVSTVLVSREAEWKGAAEVQVTSGSQSLEPGDILVGFGSRCCFEFKPLFSTAWMTSTLGDRKVALGGGFGAEYYGPRRSLLFGLSFERLSTGRAESSSLFNVEAGYQWQIRPRSFIVLGRLIGGYSSSSVPLPDALRDGAPIDVSAGGGQIAAALGVKIGLADALWLNAELGYRLAAEHSNWFDTPKDANPISVELPVDRNVDLSGPLLRAGLVFRAWPY